MDQTCKMEDVTTVKAVYIPPKSPGVRLRGMCLRQSPTEPAVFHLMPL